MKEQEIMKLQEESDNRCLYLQKVGMFYQAYGHAAFAIARLMGYKVKRHERKKSGFVYVAGFPLSSLEQVMKQMEEMGWTCECCKEDASLFLFMGADGTPDMELVVKDDGVCESRSADRSLYVSQLYETLLKDLSPQEKLKLIVLLAASIKLID